MGKMQNVCLELLHQILAHGPHASPLPVNIHGNREETQDELDDAEPDVHGPWTVVGHPVGDEQAEYKAVKDVLAEIESDKGLTRVLAVAVDGKRDGRGGAESAAKRDDAEEEGGYHPVVTDLGRPPEAHQPNNGGDEHGAGHDEAELGFIQTAVSARHGLHDDIAHLSRCGRTQDATDERRQVDEARLNGVEIVGVRRSEDHAHSVANDDEPADRARVDDGGPEDWWVGKKDERTEHDPEPIVVAEATVPRPQLLGERLGWLVTKVLCVCLDFRGPSKARLGQRQFVALHIRTSRKIV